MEGQGAFLNDSPIKSSTASTFTEALLITGFYYDRGRNIDLTLDAIRKFYDRGIMGIRRFGSAALDLCFVAAGRADGYFEIGLNAWDFAAGAFIAAQAGAVVTDAAGEPLSLKKSYIVARRAGLASADAGRIGTLEAGAGANAVVRLLAALFPPLDRGSARSPGAGRRFVTRKEGSCPLRRRSRSNLEVGVGGKEVLDP